MTDTPDTSPEAVERYRIGAFSMEPDPIGAWVRYLAYADLAAERGALREQVRHASWAGEAYALVEARAEAAEAAIKAALERLDASLLTNAEHQQAKDILREVKEGRG